MPRPNMQVSHHGAGGEMRDFLSCAFRLCRCVRSLEGLWYGWVNCTLQVTSSSVHQGFFFQMSTFNHFPTLVVVTLATVFARPLLSAYSADDPRAVWKLGVAGPELDNGCTGNSLTTGAEVLRQHCELLQPSCKL